MQLFLLISCDFFQIMGCISSQQREEQKEECSVHVHVTNDSRRRAKLLVSGADGSISIDRLTTGSSD